MTTRKAVTEFLAQKSLALAGASRSGKKMGSLILKELTRKGYQIQPVHPTATEIAGHACVANLADLAEPVDGLILVVPPAETEKLVREAAAAGIEHVWMQQGSESEDAVTYCQQQGIREVHAECILMFAKPTGLVHLVHRWLWGAVGKLPK